MNAADPQELVQAIAIWWSGQASVVLRASGTTLSIDPFLSVHPERLTPPLFTGDGC
jgi:L-ascorbate metabolism protein UlaG (beta-lactamase superfamily)